MGAGAGEMTKRYSIWVREHGATRDVEHMTVDGNPEAVADGLRRKTKLGIRENGKLGSWFQFESVRIVDNHADANPAKRRMGAAG